MSLITQDYKALQEQFHKDRPEYGTHSKSYAKYVSHIIDQLEIENILDYGAGKCMLGRTIRPKKRVKVWCYDPCIEELSEAPKPTEMVVCTDVLEHIEPICLDDVLDDLKRLTEKVIFMAIHTGPAMKVLPDGRNAHLIQQTYKWWLPKLWDRFDVHSLTVHESSINIIGYPRKANGA
jgi:hypothetical protein